MNTKNLVGARFYGKQNVRISYPNPMRYLLVALLAALMLLLVIDHVFKPAVFLILALSIVLFLPLSATATVFIEILSCEFNGLSGIESWPSPESHSSNNSSRRFNLMPRSSFALELTIKDSAYYSNLNDFCSQDYKVAFAAFQLVMFFQTCLANEHDLLSPLLRQGEV